MNEKYGQMARVKPTNGKVIPRNLLDRTKSEVRALIRESEGYLKLVTMEVKILKMLGEAEGVVETHYAYRKSISKEIAKLVEVQTAVKRVLAGKKPMTRQETQKMEKILTRMIKSSANQKIELGLAEVQRAVRKQKTMFR